ncbi:hypothetical protein RN607_03190 [Demequina capsici]|uniref:Heavy metal transporter n=1 Tax=Demequina capsici TaxID=3075620 RepID=A0AA96JDH1_9MICO|nr:hypothetical protein [Demequina sp. PMTSA13]WNM28021.1 hypothetical protein RN607_03190 [Demequina sp. PMTSA13]
MAGRPRRRGARAIAFLTFAAVATAGVIWGPAWWERHGDRFSSERCTVTVEGTSHTLTAEQADNAAIIAARSAAAGLRARAATIALATAVQESGLRNISYGDRDSLGLFQQRPSQGWGTEEEILDVRYAADAFYTALQKVSGWEDLEITVAAQAVQRSAFPNAYADHEPEARLWATALRGYGGPAAVTCDISTPDASTAAAYADRIAADFGDGMYTVLVTGIGDATSVDVTADDGSATTRDQLAAWAVATASTTGATAVTTSTSTWTVQDGMTATGDDSVGDAVRIDIRTAPQSS